MPVQHLCNRLSKGPRKMPSGPILENYFNYFTEIEEHYQRRRGTIVPLSTLDWALIETWKDAGIPLEAVLRGVATAFARYEQRPSKTKKINSLAFCAQEVLSTAEDMKQASVGVASGSNRGFQSEQITEFLRRNAGELQRAALPSRPGNSGARSNGWRTGVSTLWRSDIRARANATLSSLSRRMGPSSGSVGTYL